MSESTPPGRDELDRLCYGGESVVESVRVSGGVVGVTTHRVIALTPDSAGPNVRTVDRPNVEGLAAGSAGEAVHGHRALRYGVAALALVGGSFLVNVGGAGTVDPPATAGTAGAGGVVGMAVAMTSLLTLVDDGLRVVGALLMLGALAFAAL